MSNYFLTKQADRKYTLIFEHVNKTRKCIVDYKFYPFIIAMYMQRIVEVASFHASKESYGIVSDAQNDVHHKRAYKYAT